MDSRVGYVVPGDRVSPRDAVRLAGDAAAAGFSGTLVADLFQPWLPSLGQAPFVWGLLAAIGERAPGELAAGMVVPGYRMHPAALAQAAATLACLHPDRVWLSMAPGEAINEHVTGQRWPEAPERIDRMFEAIELIQKLFAASAAGRDTRFAGEHFTLESSRLWTFPAQPPRLLVATSGPVTARRAGRVADGLLTAGVTVEQAGRLLRQFSEGAAQAGRDHGELLRVAHVNVCWAPDPEQAVRQALDRYPIGAMRFARGDLRSPELVAQIGKLVRSNDIDDRLLVSADLGQHREMVQRYFELGFDQVYVSNVGDDHDGFIRAYGTAVIGGRPTS